MLQERQGGTVTENKQKLIALVSVLEEENIIDYCYTFISLKVYGHAKLPDSITAELRQMWEEHMLRMEQTKTEQTEEEKQAGEYRANIVRLLYGIDQNCSRRFKSLKISIAKPIFCFFIIFTIPFFGSLYMANGIVYGSCGCQIAR